MKLIFIFLLSSLSFILIGQSEMQSSDLDGQLTELRERYNLSDEQVEKVKFLLLDKQSKLDEVAPVKSNYKAYSSEQYKINTNFNSSLSDLLTEEQINNFSTSSRLYRTKTAKENKKGEHNKLSQGETTISTQKKN